MTHKRFHENIVCAYLYVITKHGYPPPAEKYIEQIKEMAALGFRTIELEGIREEHLLAVYNQKEEVEAALQEFELDIAYFCTVLPALSSMDDKVVEKQLELFEKGCEAAQLFGARGVLDNGPLPPYVFRDDIPVTRHYDSGALATATLPADMDWAKYWDHLTGTFRAVCDIADEYGLTYQVHPAEGVLAATSDGFLHFADAVDRDNLRFNFDTANLFAMKENLPLALIRLKDRIDYIHISDNGGSHIEHLAMGDGRIVWDLFFETLDRIGFDGQIGLDIGGDESAVPDLDAAYINGAELIEKKYYTKR